MAICTMSTFAKILLLVGIFDSYMSCAVLMVAVRWCWRSALLQCFPKKALYYTYVYNKYLFPFGTVFPYTSEKMNTHSHTQTHTEQKRPSETSLVVKRKYFDMF